MLGRTRTNVRKKITVILSLESVRLLHDKECCTQREDVKGWGMIGPKLRSLRRTETQCTACSSQGIEVEKRRCPPIVAQCNLKRMTSLNEYIIWFNIAMDKLHIMDESQAFTDLKYNLLDDSNGRSRLYFVVTSLVFWHRYTPHGTKGPCYVDIVDVQNQVRLIVVSDARDL